MNRVYSQSLAAFLKRRWIALPFTIVTILLEWLRAIEEPMDFGVFEIPGIPGMRMVVFSLILLAIILFRREGIMGTREITWKSIFSLGRRKA